MKKWWWRPVQSSKGVPFDLDKTSCQEKEKDSATVFAFADGKSILARRRMDELWLKACQFFKTTMMMVTTSTTLGITTILGFCSPDNCIDKSSWVGGGG